MDGRESNHNHQTTRIMSNISNEIDVVSVVVGWWW
jgi:hypothetical protein